jgi:hypothetical protein
MMSRIGMTRSHFLSGGSTTVSQPPTPAKEIAVGGESKSAPDQRAAQSGKD